MDHSGDLVDRTAPAYLAQRGRRSVVVRTATRWRELSGPQRYQLYTRCTLQSVVIAISVALSVSARTEWAVAGLLLAGAAAVVALEAQPDFAVGPTARWRRGLLVGAVLTSAAVWSTAAVTAHTAAERFDVEAARTLGMYVAFLVALSVLPFPRHRWWLLAALSLGSGALLSGSVPGAVRLALYVFVIGVVMVGTTLVTQWGLHVIDDLERAKAVEAKLRVAEERLRFSRDLHDVVGRGFSAIAVKSELAGSLLRAAAESPTPDRGTATDRAATEIDEIKSLAVQSMEQMRALVRGYRDVDLAGEVAGARSLLSAAGCLLVVDGEPAEVPDRHREVAAWVVREGTTNIVKHSAASTARLTLHPTGVSLRNDGVPADDSRTPAPRSGLRGLAERLEPVGATLDTSAHDDEFILQIRWENT
ncbi:histidine kinase [Gordonia jinghuaiqii]|uniref:Histidine kinase n=1 Tax=Gordonia jinghuaiqii TaxID=2758710 RepID=A0A7D7M0G8_9ACTN|nr:histidine kinase [Gordonia jinghuaiqii]MCR5979913.1 histidine kinase [Gordonia jinghuaiqii]QMT03116.1 histidine kinase [Gordonia jinghuaiqii]